jgi:hypothetical protein
MKTRSVLVSFPGYWFTLQTLLPNHRLAALAAGLEAAGQTTCIRDYGTASMLDRLFPRKAQATAQGISDRILTVPGAGSLSALSALWQLRGMDRMLRAQQEVVAAEIASEIAAEKRLDFVVLEVDQPEDLKGALFIAKRLRALNPSLRLAAVGSFAEAYAETLLRVFNAFDCISVQDADWSLTRWAERLDRPDTWRLIPNLVYAQHGYVRPTVECVGLDLESLPAPAYNENLYPALAGHEKLRLLGVEVSRASASETVSRTRSPRVVCEEASHWMRVHGTRAFRFLGPESTALHVDALAYEILSRGQTMWYSRSGAIRDARLQSFSTLRSSGCQAMAFDLASGSQMLVDDFHERGFLVSQAEGAVRACKLSGIFTVTGFVYPCPADDYHTRAETFRFAERTRPDAALVALPSFVIDIKAGLTPGTFNVTSDQYVRYVDSGRDRFSIPVFKGRGDGYYRHLRSLGDVLRENDVLTRELAGIGIATALTPEAALVARACGYEGQEEDFDALFRQRLFAGDAAGVAAAIERFNHRVASAANMVAFLPFKPVLAAVGN